MGSKSIEEAILEILGSEVVSYWMPSRIVGRLRDSFDPASVRPTLEDMHQRRLVASHGYAYCLPEFVDAIRTIHLQSLHSLASHSEEFGTEAWNRFEVRGKRFGDVWQAVSRWDGFGEREPLLGVFNTLRLPGSGQPEARSNVLKIRPIPPSERRRTPTDSNEDFFDSAFGPRVQKQKGKKSIARLNWGSAPEGCTVKLFNINNSSGNTLFCLARDIKRAWEIAQSAGHVRWAWGQRNWPPKERFESRRYADEIKRPVGLGAINFVRTFGGCRLQDYWPEIEEAKARRFEGTVHVEDDALFIGSTKVP